MSGSFKATFEHMPSIDILKSVSFSLVEEDILRIDLKEFTIEDQLTNDQGREETICVSLEVFYNYLSAFIEEINREEEEQE